MILFKLYRAEEDPEGGDPPKKKESAKVNTTPIQRRDWNDFLNYLQKEGVAGSKDLDQMDKNVAKTYIDKYKKDNPNTSVSEDLVPIVQREHEELRKGDSFAGMSPEQTRVMRKQFNDGFVAQAIAGQGMPFNSTLSRQYYPTFRKGDKDYGTDAEAYMKDFATPTKKTPSGDGIIPYPNYKDQKSRNNYLQQWNKKYGSTEGLGDTVLKVNETPRGGSDSIKNISLKTAKQYGIDPSVLYTSMMIEGGAGLFKNIDGTDTRHRKPGEFGYQGFYGDKDFPINGNESLGVPDFSNRFQDLVSGGYLPKSFAAKFRGTKNAGAYSENDFKTVEDGMQAKAALMKQSYDEVDKYAKENKIDLSKNGRDFFALADFNSGANFKKILKEYHDEGLLKDDKFLKEHPHKEKKIDPKDDVWAHVAPRIKLANALKEQKHFEDSSLSGDKSGNNFSDDGQIKGVDHGDGTKEESAKGPITFLNSYYNSQEFKDRIAHENFPFNSDALYKQQMDHIQKGIDNYKPFVTNVNSKQLGSQAATYPDHLMDNTSVRRAFRFEDDDKKPGDDVNVLLNTTQAKNIGANLDREVIPHEYTHTTRGLTEDEEEKIIALSKDPQKSLETYSNQKGLAGQIRNMRNRGSEPGEPQYDVYSDLSEQTNHDFSPNEKYADLNALRFMMWRKNIYDTRKGDMEMEDLKKAMKDPEIKDSFIMKRMLKNFNPEDIVKFNNTIALTSPQKKESGA